jgi:UDP-N-acetylmuramoyl-tripeptide--D-alanyl-D-alanine ligase
MLELGESGPDLHAALAEDLIRARIDKVYCCGPLMKFLWDSLPVPLRGGYAQTSTDLAPHVCQDICADDMVTVKGSLGSNMTSIVQALEAIASSAQPENTESNRGKT